MDEITTVLIELKKEISKMNLALTKISDDIEQLKKILTEKDDNDLPDEIEEFEEPEKPKISDSDKFQALLKLQKYEERMNKLHEQFAQSYKTYPFGDDNIAEEINAIREKGRALAKKNGFYYV